MDDTLLFKYFNDLATPEEVSRIEEWLKSDETHREEFDAAHMLFNMTVMQQVRETVNQGRTADAVRKPRPAPARRPLRTGLRIGMAAALAVCVAAAGILFGRREMLRQVTAMTQSVEVPAGRSLSIVLPDGTDICLNGGTRIEYPPVFAGRERRVKLSGEGLFSVVHDASRPFIVETFASEIEVLGTTFNVFTDEEHSRFSTTLAEGKVKVTLLEGGDQIILRPDEMAVLENGHLTKRPMKADDAICWTDGYINVSNVAFEELMSRFERTFDVDILISRPTMPVIGYVSGKIRISEGVEFALRILQRASDFEYETDWTTRTVIIR